MGGSSSQSTNQSQSTSASSSFLPSYSEEPILENLAQYSGQLGSAVSNWANNVWGNVANLSDEAIHSYGNIAQNAANQGAGYETEAGKGQQQYNNLIQDANTYNSADRQQFEAGRAEANATQAGDAAMQAHKQDLSSYGIDPSSGRYADLDASDRLKTAASAVGEGNTAIQNTAATGRQLRNDAIQGGQAYGNLASNSMNTALQGVAGASNTNLATANVGSNLQQAANPYLNTAMSLKYPPLGNTSASQSSSAGQSTSDSVTDPSGGGGGGGGSKSPSSGSGGQQSSPSSGGTRSGGTSSSPGGGGGTQYDQPTTFEPYDGGGGAGTDFGTYGADSWYEPGLGDPGSMGDANNYTDSSGFTDPQLGTDYGTSGDTGWGTGSIDSGMGGSNFTPDTGGWQDSLSYDPSANSSSGFSDSGGFSEPTDLAKGGLVGQRQMPKQQRPMSPQRFNFQGGGDVTPGMSPSHGGTTDDVRANLNEGEFVIPRDVVQHKGHEFFHKLISQSRHNNMKHQAMQQTRTPFNGRR